MTTEVLVENIPLATTVTMKIRTIIVIVILFLVLLIAGINWAEFTRPIPIFLLFTTVNVPIGLSMLGVMGIIGAIFLAMIGRTQTVAWFEHRSLSKKLTKAQKIADKEEESRIRDLRAVFDEEIEFVHRKLDLIMEHMDIGTPPEQVATHGEPPLPSEQGSVHAPPPPPPPKQLPQ